MKSYVGKVANSGFALAKCFVFENVVPHIEKKSIEDSEGQIKKYFESKKIAEAQLELLYNNALVELGEHDARIIKAQQLMLHDVEFDQNVINCIETEKTSAEYATKHCFEEYCNYFLSMDEEYFRARAIDVQDIIKRLIGIQSGCVAKPFDISSPVIVVANDLTPSEAVRLSKENVAGFITREGSATSHTAIIAEILNIPYIYQTDIPNYQKLEDSVIALDGFSGEIFVDPPEATVQCIGQKQQRLLFQKIKLRKYKERKCVTKSGKEVAVSASISGVEDISQTIESGADGVGLFRTEFMFIESEALPSEQKQFEVFKEVAMALKGKKVVVRAPDLGADKRLQSDTFTHELNPSLGLRGIRMCLEHREHFRTHLRAVLRASSFGNIELLMPMVTAVSEVVAVRSIMDEVAFELDREKISYRRPKLGVMIETPAAAILAKELIKHTDFFCVGTNDLVQYTLAADRQNPTMEKYYNPSHPAITFLLEYVINTAKSNNIPISACGKFASERYLAKSLINMGIDEITVFPGNVLEAKRFISKLD